MWDMSIVMVYAVGLCVCVSAMLYVLFPGMIMITDMITRFAKIERERERKRERVCRVGKNKMKKVLNSLLLDCDSNSKKFVLGCLQALLIITTVDLTDRQTFAVMRLFFDYIWSYYHDRLTVKAVTHEKSFSVSYELLLKGDYLYLTISS